LFERRARIDASVVHQNIQAAELANSSFNDTLAIVLNPYIDSVKVSNSASVCYLIDSVLTTPRLKVCQHHAGTFSGQTQSTPTADS
jgi:hypothetical protein